MLLSGILEILVVIIPPLAAIVIPILKIFDTYSVACNLFSPTIPILDTVFGVVSLLPIAGSFGKFARFYNKWFV